jgi:hypothetical protein
MINKSTFEQTIPLAQLLAEKGKNLNTLQGSPLDNVLKTCSTYGLHVEGQSFDTLSLGEVNDYLTTQCNHKLEGGYNEHNAAVSEVVDLAGKAVAQSLNFARNVVLPDIKSILEKVEQVVVGIRSNKSEPFVIVQKTPAKIFSNPLLHELVERFSNVAAGSVERREMAPLLGADVRGFISTGASQFDGEVEEILNENEGMGYAVVQNVLEGRIELNNVAPEFAVGVHLLCKALHDNPYDGVKMPLMEYNQRLARLIEQSGRIVYQEIERNLRRKKLGLLYVGGSMLIEEGKSAIVVNTDVYLDMLEKGLTPEALIGNEFLGRRYNDSQLIEKVDELTALYNREMRFREMQAQMENTNMAREAVERIFALEIVNREEGDLPVDRASLQKRLNARIGLLGESDLKSLTTLVRDLVCHVFYAHTDARRILCTIDAMGEKYPDIDPREAALLATVDYVAYWVSKQIICA